MRKGMVLVLALLASAFSVPRTTTALTLTNTALTDAEFRSVAGSLVSSALGSSIAIGDTVGTVDSAVFRGIGQASDLWVYTYRVSVSAGSVGGLTTPFGSVSNFVTTLNLGGTASADSSFNITGPLLADSTPLVTDTLADVYGVNGSVRPDSTVASDLTGVFRTLWLAGVPAGSQSRIFGVVSSLAPTLVIADALGTGSTHASPAVLAPTPLVPEPGTLLLLGSGLSGLAAWGWRRGHRGQTDPTR